MTTITLPESVTTIGDLAFRNNKLTNIEIPSSVTSIGSNALRENYNLNIIKMGGSDTTIGDNLTGNNNFRDAYYDEEKGGAGIYIKSQNGIWEKEE